MTVRSVQLLEPTVGMACVLLTDMPVLVYERPVTEEPLPSRAFAPQLVALVLTPQDKALDEPKVIEKVFGKFLTAVEQWYHHVKKKSKKPLVKRVQGRPAVAYPPGVEFD